MFKNKLRITEPWRCGCRGECGVPHDKPLLNTYDIRCEATIAEKPKDRNRCESCRLRRQRLKDAARRKRNADRNTAGFSKGAAVLPGQKRLF